MGSVSTRHPTITSEILKEWDMVADVLAGEARVKSKGEKYLKMPTGFKYVSDGKPRNVDMANAMYAAYQSRAQLPEVLAPALSAMVGLIHDRDITIELPPELEFARGKMTESGLPLDDFHREITRNLLGAGRIGVLIDAPSGGGDPHAAAYSGDRIINWDGADFFVLDEGGYVRDEFDWEYKESWRALSMEEGRYVHRSYDEESTDSGQELDPQTRGGKFLPRIPFAVANARDCVADIQPPPLLGVAYAVIANYQLSADHRWQLFMSGQETLVAINGKAPAAVGAGITHEMHGAEGLAPDLKYVSPSCSGIDAHERAMEINDRRAAKAGARIFDTQTGSSQESGEARSLRFKSETASLITVAQSSCALLEKSLKNMAMIIGADESKVIVTPPSDLMDRKITAPEVKAFFEVFDAGGMSFGTYDNILRTGGIPMGSESAEDELAAIEGGALRGFGDEVPQDNPAMP